MGKCGGTDTTGVTGWRSGGEAEREIGIARGMELRAAGVGGKNGTTEFFFFTGKTENLKFPIDGKFPIVWLVAGFPVFIRWRQKAASLQDAEGPA